MVHFVMLIICAISLIYQNNDYIVCTIIDVYRPDKLAQNCYVQTQSPKM